MDKKNIYIGVGVVATLVVGYLAYRGIKNKVTSKKEGVDKKGEDLQTSSDIGKTINVSREDGYTNVRSTMEVDSGFLGLGSNKIGQVNKNPLGTVLSSSKGNDGFVWYEVQLIEPLEGGQTKGYVRQDAISFK